VLQKTVWGRIKNNGFVKWARHYYCRDGLVLLYHRVAVLPHDPERLCVTPKHFDEQMAVLSEKYNVIPMREIIDVDKRKKSSRMSVAVTFDDGYADNLTVAKPILERWGCPATVFVSTGNMDSQKEFWWDELACCFFEKGEEMPWEFEVEGVPKKWVFKTKEKSSDFLQAVYHEVSTWFKKMTPFSREKAFDQMSEQWGITRPRRVSHGVMTSKELIQLESDGLIEVGAHTVNHPTLAGMSLLEQRDEMAGCKKKLEEVLNHSVRGMAYPYGTREDYSLETAKLAEECGFRYACGNHYGFVGEQTRRFELPRFLVGDWDGDRFQKELNAWRRL